MSLYTSRNKKQLYNRYYTSPTQGTARQSGIQTTVAIAPTTNISLTTPSNKALTLGSSTRTSGPNIFGLPASVTLTRFADRWNFPSKWPRSGWVGCRDVIETFGSGVFVPDTGAGGSSNGEISDRRAIGVGSGDPRLCLRFDPIELTEGRNEPTVLNR